MNKGVNFCMSYQDAMQRILGRGMSVVGNFIDGFTFNGVQQFDVTLRSAREEAAAKDAEKHGGRVNRSGRDGGAGKKN